MKVKRLDECCNIIDNLRMHVRKADRTEGEYSYYGANGIQDCVSDYLFDGSFVLVGEDGSVVTDKGKPVVNWASGKIWVNNHAHIIEEADGVMLRYLFHYIQTLDVAPLIRGNIPKLTGRDFRALQILVPTFSVQQKIVKTLDKFDTLTNSLTQGIPAEIEARQKQYEYYRDKLLDFKELTE